MKKMFLIIACVVLFASFGLAQACVLVENVRISQAQLTACGTNLSNLSCQNVALNVDNNVVSLPTNCLMIVQTEDYPESFMYNTFRLTDPSPHSFTIPQFEACRRNNGFQFCAAFQLQQRANRHIVFRSALLNRIRQFQSIGDLNGPSSAFDLSGGQLNP